MGSSRRVRDALGGQHWSRHTPSPEQVTLERCMPNPFFQHWKVLPLLPGLLPECGPQAWKEGMCSASPQPTLTEPEQHFLLFPKKLSAMQAWQREFLRANPFYCISTSWLGRWEVPELLMLLAWDCTADTSHLWCAVLSSPISTFFRPHNCLKLFAVPKAFWLKLEAHPPGKVVTPKPFYCTEYLSKYINTY